MFSKADLVIIFDGLRSSQTISTILFPLRYAFSARSLCGAGIAAAPGNDIPIASANAFMVEAVPMVLQCPAEGADEAMMSIYSSWLISPAASNFLASQTIVPDPVRLPLNHPLSIGPPDRTIAGISTVAAAISCAGVVLSQPVVKTTPSIKYPYRSSTNPR